jgi:hypothetical protein
VTRHQPLGDPSRTAPGDRRRAVKQRAPSCGTALVRSAGVQPAIYASPDGDSGLCAAQQPPPSLYFTRTFLSASASFRCALVRPW